MCRPSSGGGARPEASGGEALPQGEEFRHLKVLITSEGKLEPETDGRISACVCCGAGAEPNGEALDLPLHALGDERQNELRDASGRDDGSRILQGVTLTGTL